MTGPTRVLVWSDLFWPYIGGAELLMSRLMVDLRERGYEFLVVTSHDSLDLPDEDEYEGIPIRRFPFRRAIAGPDFGAMREARRGIAELKRTYAADLLHAHGVLPSLVFHLRTANGRAEPLLVGLQQEVGFDQPSGPGTLVHKAMVSASWVAACSEAVLVQARRTAPEITPRSSVIRNTLDVAAAPCEEPPAVPRLLCLGRLVPQKGFDVALEAFATLVPRFPGLRLGIAGDGDARGALERQAAALGVQDAVDFLGWIEPDRVTESLSQATVVLMPSRWEGLGLVAVQAAAVARPVVASRVGGLPEVVVDGQTGMLVDPEDARGLAEAVALLLEQPDEARRMGRAGRNRVREFLSFDRCVDAYDELYRSLTRR